MTQVRTTTKNSNDLLIKMVKSGDLKGVKDAIDNGADVYFQKWRMTALMMAAWTNHFDIVKLLLQAGADVNQQNENGWTALTYAANKGSTETVNLLIQAGANVNHQNENNGWTPLVRAGRSGHTEIVKFLIEKGAKVNATGGKTALIEAAIWGRTDIVKMLIEHGADYEDLMHGYDVIKKIVKELKEELCSEFLKMDKGCSGYTTRESLMEDLSYKELKAMVEGHPSRLNLAQDPDFN